MKRLTENRKDGSKLGDRVISAIGKAIERSVICNWLSTYTPFDNDCLFTRFFGKLSKPFGRFRRHVTEKLENSFILHFFSKLFQTLLSTDLFSFGMAFLASGIVTLLGTIAGGVEWSFALLNNASVLGGVLLFIFGVVCLFSPNSLGRCLCTSKIFHLILVDGFCIDEDLLNSYLPKRNTLVFMALGIVAGGANLLYSPWYVLSVLAVILFAVILLYQPEIGLAFSTLLFPFVSFHTLLTISVASILSFGLKHFRGKRVIHTGWVDMYVLLFGAFVVLNGFLLASSPNLAVKSTFVILVGILLYLAIANSMPKQHRTVGLTYLLLLSGTVYAVLAVFPFFSGSFFAEWFSTGVMPFAFIPVKGLLGSSVDTAAYMALLIPIALSASLNKNRPLKILGIISLCAMVLCLRLTGFRSAFAVVLIVALIMVAVNHIKILKAVPVILILVLCTIFLLPDSVKEYIFHLESVTTLVSGYASTWQGVSKLLQYHWVSGIGLGAENFKNAYYAYVGMKGVIDSGSLYFQLVTAMGVFALAIFICLAITVIRLALNGFFELRKDNSGICMLGYGGGIIAYLLVGLYHNVWMNNTLVFAFWIVLGILVSCNRAYKHSWNDSERGD